MRRSVIEPAVTKTRFLVGIAQVEQLDLLRVVLEEVQLIHGAVEIRICVQYIQYD